MKTKQRMSKNIDDRRPSPSDTKTSRVTYHKAGDPTELGMRSVIKMSEVGEGLSSFPKKMGKKNEYKVGKGKNTRPNGTIPVPEDKPRKAKAGASNPPTQKWDK